MASRRSRAAAVAAAAALVLAGLPARCPAGRPLVIDDAAPVDAGRVQVEAGAAYLRTDRATAASLPFTLAYGTPYDFEVGVGSALLRNDPGGPAAAGDAGGSPDAGPADVSLGAKWRVLDAAAAGRAVALAAAVKFPTADADRGLGTGRADYDLALIVTQVVGPAAVDLNAAVTLVGDPVDGGVDPVWRYGLAVRCPVSAEWWAVAEGFALTPAAGPTVVQVNVGAQWAVGPDLVFDAAVGTATDGGPDVAATVGLTWLY